ncbi:MAG: hypothetical protein KF859_11790 [Phycisphaeraceae bacterium]|nr:hypothetical protein [Phycisphaeraceae bacterium]
MFGKLLLVVATCGLLGAWLLSLRQERVQISSEIARAQLRVNKQDETLWLLRARIARQVTPREVERLAANIGPLHPIVPGDSGSATLYALNTTTQAATTGAPGASIRTVSLPTPAGASSAKPAPKPAAKPATNPPTKPTTQAKPAAKPAAKPQAKPQSTPAGTKPPAGKTPPTQAKPPVKRPAPTPKPGPSRLASRPNTRE